MTNYTKGDKRILYWDREDTPIPKKGEILSTIFGTKWKILSVSKDGKDYKITMEML